MSKCQFCDAVNIIVAKLKQLGRTMNPMLINNLADRASKQPSEQDAQEVIDRELGNMR